MAKNPSVEIGERLTLEQLGMSIGITEVGRWLGIEERTVHRYKRSGLLPQALPRMQGNAPLKWRVSSLLHFVRSIGKPELGLSLEELVRKLCKK